MRYRSVTFFSELLVSLGAGKDHIDPYSHRLWRRRDEKQRTFDRLDAERGLWVRAARPPLMVDEHVLDCLEPDEGAVSSLLGLVRVVVQAALGAVEHEPASFPLSDRGAGAQLGQIAMTGARRQPDVLTLVETMTGRFNETTQVEVTVTHRQVARQRTRARLQNTCDTLRDVKTCFCAGFLCRFKTFFVRFLFFLFFWWPLLSIFNAHVDCLNQIDTVNGQIK